MYVDEVLDRFIEDSPIAVMARLTLEHLLDDERLDDVFRRNAVQQKCGELLFSTVADLMGLVALKIKPSVNAAYKHRTKEDVGVAITSIYNKLQGIEPSVGRALVRETASDLEEALRSMPKGLPKPQINGYRTRIIDGNHFAGTEHRIEELRHTGAAALPGQCIPILDPDLRLMIDVIPCEDGHASECTLIPEILELVQPGEVWIGDRKFGTMEMMTSIALDKKAHFIFRQSKGLVPNWTPIGKRVKIGRSDTGTVYEQKIEIVYNNRRLKLRRITINLDHPTRKGETEIHLLSNLPTKVGARKIAMCYRNRWSIETAFQHVEQSLNAEIETLGYPKAALFSFCMGLMMYNLLSTVKCALASANGSSDVYSEVSTYYVALEVSESWRGFVVAMNDDEFRDWKGTLTNRQLGRKLTSLARHVNLERVRASKRGPKRPRPQRKSGNRGNHVSTDRILRESRGKMLA